MRGRARGAVRGEKEGIMPRRRGVVPENTQAMWEFCRHCGSPFPPEDSPVRGVCPACAEARYGRCGSCGGRVEQESLLAVEGGLPLCAACAAELTRVCDGCGRRFPQESGFVRDGRGRALCPECAEGHAECADCGAWFPEDDMAERDGELVCWRCSARRLDGAICSYGYKPRPRFHRAEGEAGNSLVLGIELEMDGGDRSAAVARIADKWGEDWLYFKSDSSLDCGVELVTHPISPLVLMSEEGRAMWADVCAAALAEGMRSHDTRTCGLHVHVNRDFFGEGEAARVLAEYKLLTVADRFFEPFAIFSRRRRDRLDQWAGRTCLPVSRDGWLASARSASRVARDTRYHAVNTTNEHTVEFRLFRGTLKPETLLATFQFVAGLCHLAKASTPGRLQRVDWYELADGILEACPTEAGELAEYLLAKELMTEANGRRGALCA